jgi:hypothetical protein
VPGNHEYYYNPSPEEKRQPIAATATIQGVNQRIQNFFKETSPKLHFLNCSSIKLAIANSKYHIIGATLWTWIPEDKHSFIKNNMNDYSFIYTTSTAAAGQQSTKQSSSQPTAQSSSQSSIAARIITPQDVSDLHVKHYRYLKSQITKANKGGYRVVVLTHHKPYESMSGESKNDMSYAYENNLKMLMTPQVALWAYGHTHVSDKTTIGKTLLYSNPKGYPGQKTKYQRDDVLAIS